MYIALTGSENNKDVYIYHSFRKENGKSSSRIYKKLGKYNCMFPSVFANIESEFIINNKRIIFFLFIIFRMAVLIF